MHQSFNLPEVMTEYLPEYQITTVFEVSERTEFMKRWIVVMTWLDSWALIIEFYWLLFHQCKICKPIIQPHAHRLSGPGWAKPLLVMVKNSLKRVVWRLALLFLDNTTLSLLIYIGIVCIGSCIHYLSENSRLLRNLLYYPNDFTEANIYVPNVCIWVYLKEFGWKDNRITNITYITYITFITYITNIIYTFHIQIYISQSDNMHQECVY